MAFTRSEREADWALHLWSVKEMFPYFFAANHMNYARYGLYYLRSMECLPPDMLSKLMEGQHVMRHKPGLWNGLWSDMWIETTFMRYGKGPREIKGITLQPSSLKRWSLTLHLCSQLTKDVEELKESKTDDAKVHKEENTGRIVADSEDRKKIKEKLDVCINPLDPTLHPSDGVINVATGRIGPENVNVYDAVSVGKEQMKMFTASLPSGWHDPISKQVTTMNVINKKTKPGSTAAYDSDLMYSRMIGLCESCGINTRDMFAYELAPVPTSMFDDDVEMRIAKNKSDLKRKLQVESSTRTMGQPDVIVIDGCAMLWVIHYPSNGTVLDFCKAVSSYVLKRMIESDVFVVFDWYFDFRIKSFA